MEMAKAFIIYLDEAENNFLRTEMEKLAKRNLEGLTPEEVERSNSAQAILFDLDNGDVDDGDSDDGEDDDEDERVELDLETGEEYYINSEEK
jgi:hypothetical protein